MSRTGLGSTRPSRMANTRPSLPTTYSAGSPGRTAIPTGRCTLAIWTSRTRGGVGGAAPGEGGVVPLGGAAGVVAGPPPWHAPPTSRAARITPQALRLPIPPSVRHRAPGRLSETCSIGLRHTVGVSEWQRGDGVVLRETWGGAIWAARAVTVVQDGPEQRSVFVPRGNRWMAAVDERGEPLRLPTAGWRLAEFAWDGGAILSFAW